MKKYCWILIVLIAQVGFSQMKLNTDIKKEIQVDGKCYAKTPIAIYKTHEETYPVFTGEKKPRGVKLKKKTLVIKEPITKWEKKKSSKNCLSADPNDCMVWCLVEEIPGETAYFQYVKNTSKTTEFEMQTFTIYTKIKSKIDELQIVCESDVNEILLKDIQSQLDELGYMETSAKKVSLQQEVKSALGKYQRDHGLPVGHFDYQTLEKLNVIIP